MGRTAVVIIITVLAIQCIEGKVYVINASDEYMMRYLARCCFTLGWVSFPIGGAMLLYHLKELSVQFSTTTWNRLIIKNGTA